MKIQSINYSNNIKPNYTTTSSKKGGSVSFSALREDTYVRPHKRRRKHKKRNPIKNTLFFLTGAGLSAAGAFGLIFNPIPNVSSNNDFINFGIYSTYNAEKENDFLVGEDDIEYSPEEETKAAVEKIFEENPEVEIQYNKIADTINTYNEHLGEDGLSLIKQKVEEIGEGKVDTIDVLKILFIESNGQIYSDIENGTILKSNAGAYGSFQVTKDTADYLNWYYGLEGTDKELDVEDPYSNLEACIYNLKFLSDKRGKEIAEGASLPTGDNLKNAMAWSYHDGAWAESVTKYGQDYIDKFETLSLLDEYPVVIDYLLV